MKAAAIIVTSLQITGDDKYAISDEMKSVFHVITRTSIYPRDEVWQQVEGGYNRIDALAAENRNACLTDAVQQSAHLHASSEAKFQIYRLHRWGGITARPSVTQKNVMKTSEVARKY